LLPSLIVLLPLIVLLGERADEPMDSEIANGILYWLLVAAIRNRYSGATDTLLGSVGDDAQIPRKPFLVTRFVEARHKTLKREHPESLPLSQIPAIETQPYQGELILLPVTNVE
jgi:hypothetical protein